MEKVAEIDLAALQEGARRVLALLEDFARRVVQAVTSFFQALSAPAAGIIMAIGRGRYHGRRKMQKALRRAARLAAGGAP